jgi:hypothetical protein
VLDEGVDWGVCLGSLCSLGFFSSAILLSFSLDDKVTLLLTSFFTSSFFGSSFLVVDGLFVLSSLAEVSISTKSVSTSISADSSAKYLVILPSDSDLSSTVVFSVSKVAKTSSVFTKSPTSIRNILFNNFLF